MRDGARRTIGAAAIAVGLLVGVVPQVTARTTAPDGSGVVQLGEDDKAFWEGTVGGPLPLPGAEFRIDVLEPAARLRVAMERPSGYGAEMSLTLVGPDGVPHATADSPVRDAAQQISGFHSVEAFVEDPMVGEWLARVTTRTDTASAPFRMRAALESAPRVPRQARRLLPNLRVTPPFELTFANPDTSSTNGCLPEERDSRGARVCLRFSAGPMNVGDGPLDLLYAEVGAMEGDIVQRIHWSDGRVEEVPGGTYHYHFEHKHYHHDSIGGNELLRVEPDGSLTQVSSTPKTGYCMGDYFIADWRSFRNEAARTVDEQARSCGLTGPLGANLGLATGWGDVYGWSTPGNYVEFDGAGDGEYVVRMASNDDGDIVESDRTDDISYTHFTVTGYGTPTGPTIEVLERGIGLGPTDPTKVVVDDDYRLPLAP